MFRDPKERQRAIGLWAGPPGWVALIVLPSRAAHDAEVSANGPPPAAPRRSARK